MWMRRLAGGADFEKHRLKGLLRKSERWCWCFLFCGAGSLIEAVLAISLVGGNVRLAPEVFEEEPEDEDGFEGMHLSQRQGDWA